MMKCFEFFYCVMNGEYCLGCGKISTGSKFLLFLLFDGVFIGLLAVVRTFD